jgi:hypothetical protein
MPLAGTGDILGSVLASAVGAPSAIGSFFATVGGVIAAWAPENIQVQPGAMAAASGAVSGLGSFSVSGTKEDLGNSLATALAIPLDADMARARWITVAEALIGHFEDYGQANGTGLSSGSPLTGAGTLQWTSPIFVPLLSGRLEVSEPVSAAAVDAFGAQLLNHISSNAAVVAISLADPPVPLSAPTDGPVTGTGTIA